MLKLGFAKDRVCSKVLQAWRGFNDCHGRNDSLVVNERDIKYSSTCGPCASVRASEVTITASARYEKNSNRLGDRRFGSLARQQVGHSETILPFESYLLPVLYLSLTVFTLESNKLVSTSQQRATIREAPSSSSS